MKNSKPQHATLRRVCTNNKGIIKMRDWLYFYIEFKVKRGKVFKKEPGWALGLQKIKEDALT